jgi:hypothetical protein
MLNLTIPIGNLVCSGIPQQTINNLIMNSKSIVTFMMASPPHKVSQGIYNSTIVSNFTCYKVTK